VEVRNFRSGFVGNRAAVSRHTDADFQPDEESADAVQRHLPAWKRCAPTTPLNHPTQNPVGAWLASDGVGSVDEEVGHAAVFAGKPAPTRAVLVWSISRQSGIFDQALSAIEQQFRATQMPTSSLMRKC
jgi:hypothetical protein